MAAIGGPADGKSSARRQHVVSIRNRPVFLEEDWEKGIGGGLWSTGLALAKYLDTEHAQSQLEQRSILRVLELGSGNGFLAVCLLAACPTIKQVVVTDTEEHLGLMQATIDANGIQALDGDLSRAIVREYLWGSGAVSPSGKGSELGFDMIIGSDLAYRDALHDPLIEGILECSSHHTITLLGVTMNDTKPIFFSKLNKAGLQYERLADHLLDPQFRGINFGIFAIRRQAQDRR